jgi:hypothetical protein
LGSGRLADIHLPKKKIGRKEVADFLKGQVYQKAEPKIKRPDITQSVEIYFLKLRFDHSSFWSLDFQHYRNLNFKN